MQSSPIANKEGGTTKRAGKTGIGGIDKQAWGIEHSMGHRQESMGRHKT